MNIFDFCRICAATSWNEILYSFASSKIRDTTSAVDVS